MYWAMYGQTVTSFGKTVVGIWERPNTYLPRIRAVPRAVEPVVHDLVGKERGQSFVLFVTCMSKQGTCDVLRKQ